MKVNGPPPDSSLIGRGLFHDSTSKARISFARARVSGAACSFVDPEPLKGGGLRCTGSGPKVPARCLTARAEAIRFGSNRHN
jgi:hypothetical protein